jgi:hypothetical protein
MGMSRREEVGGRAVGEVAVVQTLAFPAVRLAAQSPTFDTDRDIDPYWRSTADR